MRNRILSALGAAALLVIAGCAAPSALPASTTTGTPPPVTVTKTAPAKPAVTVTASAAPKPAASKTDANTSTICGLMAAALDHVDAISTNYSKKDGSAPYSFVKQTAEETLDLFTTVTMIYLGSDYDGQVDAQFQIWRVSVIALRVSGDEDSRVAKLKERGSDIRSTCAQVLKD